MFSYEFCVALHNFLGSFIIFLTISILNIKYDLITLNVNVLIFFVIFVNLYFLLRFYYTNYAFQIAIRACILGFLFALGIYIKLVAPENIQIFGIYMCVMSFFHFSEFMAIAKVQPKQVSTDSFVLNHSPQYIVAAVSSWIEFLVETYFFPEFKQIFWLSNLGLVICVIGEILRLAAILTADSNFHHLVQCEKTEGHFLVTNGVYSWCRHPSYVGWFYWSIGTQIILLNPICIPAYAIASWNFFKTRIYIEEITLLNFFGQQYCDYQKCVGTGIPFIDGYKI